HLISNLSYKMMSGLMYLFDSLTSHAVQNPNPFTGFGFCFMNSICFLFLGNIVCLPAAGNELT
ncbi:MAG: hypothetical protein ACLSWS_22420, partial [Faecalispora jeddahensis]